MGKFVLDINFVIMKPIFIYILIIFTLLTSACSKNEPEVVVPVQMTLIYAVNNSSLSSDLTSNENGMLDAMKNVDTQKYKLLLYKYHSDGPVLYEAVNRNGDARFEAVKHYDNSIPSIDRDRIADVINDALGMYPDVSANLFFWGHGLGWVNKYKYSDNVRLSSVNLESSNIWSKELTENHAFGGEYVTDINGIRTTEFIDIDRLAEVIPDNSFDLIWFDCCYMSSIEVVYQLRNKCKTFVGYPTEILAEGLPYHKVLPYLVSGAPDYTKAADALYNYYSGTSSKSNPVTVAVLDMTKIEDVANASGAVFALGESRPLTGVLQNYSTFRDIRYYDFGQYMREYADVNSKADATKAEIADKAIKYLQSAMSSFVIYANASAYDFSYPSKPISKENYSGLSIYNYLDINSPRADYYRSLDWYKRVWK